MRKPGSTYPVWQKIVAIFMFLVLLWLTICAPFVAAMDELETNAAWMQAADMDDESSDSDDEPINEEKVQANAASLSEYLHHTHELFHLAGLAHKFRCLRKHSVYVAFHGEMLCPPPNCTIS